jgi:hypothetical protein
LHKISRFILAIGCMELAAYSQTVPVADEGPAVFVFRIVSVGAGQRDAFVTCLAKSDLPFWRDLKKKGLLAKASVFETTSVTSSEPGVPAWNFVISSKVAPDATADSFLQAVEKRKGCDSAPGIDSATVNAAAEAANRQISPGSGSYQELIAPLRPFRTIPRMDRVRQLFELAVR